MKKCSVLLVLVLFCRATPARGQNSFAGTWDTTYGPVTLTQTGNKVTGIYYGGRATLAGTVAKNKLTFTYKEPQSGKAWFELAGDGKSFTGKYLADGSSTWIQWNGTRK